MLGERVGGTDSGVDAQVAFVLGAQQRHAVIVHGSHVHLIHAYAQLGVRRPVAKSLQNFDIGRYLYGVHCQVAVFGAEIGQVVRIVLPVAPDLEPSSEHVRELVVGLLTGGQRVLVGGVGRQKYEQREYAFYYCLPW